MSDQKDRKEIKTAGEISRRDFLKLSGIAVIGVGFGGCAVSNGEERIPKDTFWSIQRSARVA